VEDNMRFEESGGIESPATGVEDKHRDCRAALVNDEDMPGRLRRRSRQLGGMRFTCVVSSILDAETYKAVHAVAEQHRVTRSLAIADILRDWAARGAQSPASLSSLRGDSVEAA
jgi:hypothetical protein